MENHKSLGDGKEGEQQNRGTILLIEDEEMLRTLTETILVDHGFVVLAAADGLEGLALFKKHKERISVVLTDLHLPKMDGCTAFLEMNRIDPSVKAVFASGHIDLAMKRKLQQAGVRHFIHKPFAIDEVLEAIFEIMGDK